MRPRKKALDQVSDGAFAHAKQLCRFFMTHSVQIHIHRCTRLLGIRFGQKPAKQQQICNGSLLRSVFYQHILFKQLASATSIARTVSS